MMIMTLPALKRGRLSRAQGIILLCIYAAFCAIQFTMRYSRRYFLAPGLLCQAGGFGYCTLRRGFRFTAG